MSSVIPTIKKICKLTKITNDWSFDICGERKLVANYQEYKEWKEGIQSFGSNIRSQGIPEQAILEKLQQYIYKYFYSTGSTHPDLSLLKKYGDFALLPEEQNRFMNHLSLHNTSIIRYDLYWEVDQVTHDSIVVKKNGMLKKVKPNGYVPVQPSIPLARGHLVNVLNKKEDRELQTYFYYVYGNDQPTESEELIRFYFNFEPSEIHRLIRQLTSLFNKYELPFSFKCLNHPDYYHCRADGAVLYIEKRHRHLAWMLIKKSYEALESYFLSETPLFTYKIFPGLGFAENPGQHQSFGMTKSYIVSLIIINEYKLQRKCTTKEITDILTAYGTDAKKPYLNVDSGVAYQFIQN